MLNALAHDPKMLWHYLPGDGPTIGVAIHAGHEVRPALLPYLAIDEVARIREEDPYTDFWTLACDHQLITRRSRFEVDLNRHADEAMCVQPGDCWNLEVWNESLPREQIDNSMAEHAAFYAMLKQVLQQIEQRHGKFVVYDIHSYNHRRDGPQGDAADPVTNPEINIGTGSMNRDHWAPVVDGLIDDLRKFDFLGRQLDVRENINFRGRQLCQFVHETFPQTGCAIAIEVKKFFMDEWTGVSSPEHVNAMREAFASTIPGVTRQLGQV